MNEQAPLRSSLPGTRPAGARDEAEAAQRVREMFSRIAPHYDFLNHLLSLRFDHRWRRCAARRFRHILARPDARVLDLCCGTGDLTMALRQIGPAAVFGADFAHPMLVRAREKEGARGDAPDAAACGGRCGYAEADALQLPFADASFDLATSAFGFRNLANYERGLREIHRVLRPGGGIGILEFAEPRGEFFGRLYGFYFTRILPRLGGAISGSAAAYSYLPSSVMKFPQPEEMAGLMQEAGFTAVQFERWTGGIVALHIARRL